jgi:peptide deformylase
MALRNIRILGDDILRKKCKPVENVDAKVLMLLKDMAETMYNTRMGAGLAAPQVGILKRLVVIDMGDGLINLINPEIIEAEGQQEAIEGCLSVPGKWGRLKRPAKVQVRALNENGTEVFISGEKDLAKCLCHEIDHLDGILFIDKVIEYIDAEKVK